MNWISVKDRLPEEGYYLVFIKNPGPFKYIYVAYYYGDNEWNVDGEVTHWKPLPEPPKE